LFKSTGTESVSDPSPKIFAQAPVKRYEVKPIPRIVAKSSVKPKRNDIKPSPKIIAQPSVKLEEFTRGFACTGKHYDMKNHSQYKTFEDLCDHLQEYHGVRFVTVKYLTVIASILPLDRKFLINKGR
jgi:hypothetical protein